MNVLFVCTANICRSAYAEAAARHAAPHGVCFSSAGTHALVGQGIDPPMAEELRRRGVDPSRHHAQQLTAGLVEAADLILVMSPRHREFILDEWPAAARRTFLIGHGARVAQGLEGDVEAARLAELLWSTRTSGIGEAVADPYGKGAAAAKACAAQIDIFLTDILGVVN